VSFAFLSAAALAMAVLALGPILAHLARQTPVERQPFGAMMLLLRLTRRLRRRRRLRDLLLLLLRVALVLAVVLLAGRPELRLPDEEPEVGGSGRVVVVLDNSMSMSQRAGSASGSGSLLARARERAAELVRSLPEGSFAGAVVTAGPAGGAERLLPLMTRERAQVARALERTDASWQGTDLKGALRQARLLLVGAPGEVVVFSDEAGLNPVRATEAELARLLEQGAEVLPRPILATEPRNATISEVVYGDGVEGGSLLVSVVGYGDVGEVAVTITLPDDSQMTAFAQPAPCPGPPEVGQEAPVCEPLLLRFTVPPEVPGGVGKAKLQDGALSSDDATWFHLPRVGASRVLVVDGDPGPTPIRSEVYFLERALAPWGRLGTGVTPEVTAPAGIAQLDPQRHRVVFLANVADPRPMADRLSAFVRQGGGLVIAAGDNITPERYNAALSQLLPSSLRRVRNLVALDAQGGVPLKPPGQGATSELFRPFSRQGRAAFSQVYQRRLLTLEPYLDDEEVRTLLSLDNGLPFLVERRVGRGRVLLLAGSVDLAWGNMPLQAVFLPFVQRLVGWLGGESGGATARFDGLVGELVEVPIPSAEIVPRVEGPTGEPVAAETVAGQLRFRPRVPGAYTLSLPGAPPLAWVAVNTPPAESDVRRHAALASVERALDPSRLMRRVGLGAPLLGLALALLLLQALLAVPWRKR